MTKPKVYKQCLISPSPHLSVFFSLCYVTITIMTQNLTSRRAEGCHHLSHVIQTQYEQQVHLLRQRWFHRAHRVLTPSSRVRACHLSTVWIQEWRQREREKCGYLYTQRGEESQQVCPGATIFLWENLGWGTVWKSKRNLKNFKEVLCQKYLTISCYILQFRNQGINSIVNELYCVLVIKIYIYILFFVWHLK